jgi:hypothetical protein
MYKLVTIFSCELFSSNTMISLTLRQKMIAHINKTLSIENETVYKERLQKASQEYARRLIHAIEESRKIYIDAPIYQVKTSFYITDVDHPNGIYASIDGFTPYELVFGSVGPNMMTYRHSLDKINYTISTYELLQIESPIEYVKKQYAQIGYQITIETRDVVHPMKFEFLLTDMY